MLGIVIMGSPLHESQSHMHGYPCLYVLISHDYDIVYPISLLLVTLSPPLYLQGGHTALSLAREKGHEGIVQLLQQYRK